MEEVTTTEPVAPTTTVVPSEEQPPKEPTPAGPTPEEIQRAEQHLANIQKAIVEANAELSRKRAEKRSITDTPAPQPQPVAPVAPAGTERVIDLSDPDAQAWDAHIKKQAEARLAPFQQEAEREKAEIRSFALQEFLRDKPAIASNPDKLKELLDVYERIHTATERTKEGVLLDLNKSYAALYHDVLLETARKARVETARKEQLFAEPATDAGATSYTEGTPRKRTLTAEEKSIIAQWGISEEEYLKDYEKYGE